MQTIQLANSALRAIVDDEDAPALRAFRWHLTGSGYAARGAGVRGRRVFMQRQIMDAPSHLECDHKNRNKLDNRRENLRACRRDQNGCNLSKIPNRSSRFKGVSYDKGRGKWAAYIKVHQKHIHLGRYDEEVVAAGVYDTAARERFGEFAATNFP